MFINRYFKNKSQNIMKIISCLENIYKYLIEISKNADYLLFCKFPVKILLYSLVLTKYFVLFDTFHSNFY